MPGRFTPEVIQLLEHIPNAFYALDQDLRFIHANRRVQELMGRKERELIGRLIWDVFPHYRGSPLFDTLTGAVETGIPAHLEEYFPPLSRWFEVYAYPSEYGLAVYVNDITDRKKTEIHLGLLNRAGERLAMNHDTGEALEQVGRLVVPGYADWFTVDMLKGDRVELLVMTHEDPEKVKWGVAYRERTEIDIVHPKPGSVGWVIRIGVPLLVNMASDELVKAAAQDEEHLEVLQQLQIHSSMVVPMPFKGRNIGAVTFISSRPDHRYDEADLSFAKDLAIRIGLTIENAQLFEEAKRELSARIRQGLKLG